MCIRTEYTPKTASDGLVIPCHKLITHVREPGQPDKYFSPIAKTAIPETGWIIGQFTRVGHQRNGRRKHWLNLGDAVDIGYVHAFIPYDDNSVRRSIELPHPPVSLHLYESVWSSNQLQEPRRRCTWAFAVAVEAYENVSHYKWCPTGVFLATRALFVPACCTNYSMRKETTRLLHQYSYEKQPNRKILGDRFPFLKRLLKSYV